MKPIMSNIMLVSGSGQNTGKTSLVCKMLTHFSKETVVGAVKITHHLKTLAYEMPLVFEKIMSVLL